MVTPDKLGKFGAGQITEWALGSSASFVPSREPTMANGHTVSLPVELLGSPSIELKSKIGEAAAAAVIASCLAIKDFWAAGAMTLETRESNGTHIANLYMLSQETGIDESTFATMVRAEGKRTLYARYGAWFRAHHNGADIPEPMLDMLLDDLIAILGKVTAAERLLAH